MATGYEKDIDLAAPEARESATLLSVARPIPSAELVHNGTNRFPAGVTWLPWGAGGLTTDDVGCSVVYDKNARDLPAVAFQQAFLLYDGLKCSTLGSELGWLWDRLDANFELYASAAFAAELETGAHGTFGLVGDADYPPAVVSATAVSLAVGIAHLEAHLAEVLQGGLGIIHLTPGLLVLAFAEGLIVESGTGYRTATGHAVIGDAGHTGQAAPEGQAAPGDGEAWIYATGQIWTAMSGPDKLIGVDGMSQVNVRRNENQPLTERFGLFALDPNLVGAALVTVGLSGGAGGAGGGDASAANQTTANNLLTEIETAVDGLEATLSPTIVAEVVTVDETIGTANWLWGYSIRNTTAGLASLSIRNGDDSADPPRVYVRLAENETVTVIFPVRLPCPDGIRWEMETGTADGVVYYEV